MIYSNTGNGGVVSNGTVVCRIRTSKRGSGGVVTGGSPQLKTSRDLPGCTQKGFFDRERWGLNRLVKFYPIFRP